MPVALISTSTSPSRGPSRSTVSMLSGLPACHATAALVFMRVSGSWGAGNGMRNPGRGVLRQMAVQRLGEALDSPGVAAEVDGARARGRTDVEHRIAGR